MTNASSQGPRTFIDLFAGVGGFHHALDGMGLECKLAVELDPEARAVYAASFPEMDPSMIRADIRSLTRVAPHEDADELTEEQIREAVPEHDVLCAGFPCQPFSKSGAQQGVRDKTRGTLFFDVMSIVIACKPQFVILENVRNLAGPRHEDTFETIIESLRDAGYRVASKPVVMSPHFLPRGVGAPQVRERVFILAELLPAGSHEDRIGDLLVERGPVDGWDPHDWRVEEILDPNVDAAKYGLRDVEQGWLDAWQWFVQNIPQDTLPGFPIWVDAFRLRPQIPEGTPRWKADFLRKNSDFFRLHQDVIRPWLKMRWGPLQHRVTDFPPSRQKLEWQAGRAQKSRASRDLEGLVAHLRPSGIRVKPATYLPALVAITQTSVIGPKVTGTTWRRLAPQEAAELQQIPFAGFARSGVPDKAIYKQLGNAVNVGVVQLVAEALFSSAGVAPAIRQAG